METETITGGGELHPAAAVSQPMNSINQSVGQSASQSVGQYTDCGCLNSSLSGSGGYRWPGQMSYLFHYIHRLMLISPKQQKTQLMMISLSLLTPFLAINLLKSIYSMWTSALLAYI